MSLGYISEARHYMRDPRSQVLAAYLDNDQEGCADDPNMLTSGLHLGLKLPGSGTRTQVVNGLALLPKLQIAEHANRSRAASRLYAGLQELFADEMRPECSGERGVRPSPSASPRTLTPANYGNSCKHSAKSKAVVLTTTSPYTNFHCKNPNYFGPRFGIILN